MSDKYYIDGKEIPKAMVNQIKHFVIVRIKNDLHPCINCPSFIDEECDNKIYFEDVCRSEKTLSYEDVLQALEKAIE